MSAGCHPPPWCCDLPRNLPRHLPHPLHWPYGEGHSDTRGGLEDSRQHGADFRSVYADLLGFLPAGSDREAYSFRVTNNVITSATLGAFVAGLYPGEEEYAAWVQPASFDSLEPSFRCPAADRVREEIQSEDAWLQHLNVSAGLMARIDAVGGLGPDDESWHVSYDQ